MSPVPPGATAVHLEQGKRWVFAWEIEDRGEGADATGPR